MKITKLKLNNFQLFKDLEISLDNVNLITGINLDDLASSGNGAGKSTIINAIIFALYGDIAGLNLKDLVRIGTTQGSVELECSLNNEQYRIIRRIPSAVEIYKNKVLMDFSTNTLAQLHLNKILGHDINKFRMYRVIDNNKGINLLDLGTLSLRKTLMEFVDIYFSKIRASLLAKKLEKERFNIDKRLYTFHLSEKRLELLKIKVQTLMKEQDEIEKDSQAQNKVLTSYLADIRSRENNIYSKNLDLKKLNNGMCPILKEECPTIKGKQAKVEKAHAQEIKGIQDEIKEIKNLITNEEDALMYYSDMKDAIRKKINKTENYIMKLKEAFKFQEYKYTKADVQLYTDSIKILDSFASYYVQEWLMNLSIIINDLLKPINISVEFSVDKDFIKVNNNHQELKYSQLSSGQKTFLNTIFKIGILLNEGITNGLLLIDEGLGNLDYINLEKLLNILKGLNFQCLLIYQNIDNTIKDVKFIELERKDGETKLK